MRTHHFEDESRNGDCGHRSMNVCTLEPDDEDAVNSIKILTTWHDTDVQQIHGQPTD
jgi:hypothetical protein